MQRDPAWRDQTGAPDDPQPGNIPGGARDVLRGATFNDGGADGFVPDSGLWTVDSGRYEVAPELLGGDAVSVFYVDAYRPLYFEMQASINASKPTAGYKSNAYLIFDYQSPTDFKCAGINVSIDKLQMGHRDETGWHVDVQTPAKLKPDNDYNLLLAVNGVTATLVVNNAEVLNHVFSPRIIDGFSYGLNTGMVGIGSDNSKARIDNVVVQILPPEYTLDSTEDFADQDMDLMFAVQSGLWSVNRGVYQGVSALSDSGAVSLVDLGLDTGLSADSLLELKVTIATAARSGIVFDHYGPQNYKFAVLDVENDLVMIGHSTDRGGIKIDATADYDLKANADYELGIILKGLSVSIAIDDHVVTGYIYNGVVVDGRFGLIGFDESISCDTVNVKTDDSAFRDQTDQTNLMAAEPPDAYASAQETVTSDQLLPIIAEAKRRWIDSALLDDSMIRALEFVDFQIVDLQGLTLATTIGNTVYIDVDAAGHGWFVDLTPGEDEEFHQVEGATAWIAAESSLACDRIDLMTVVMHELGHVMGIEHSGSDAADSDLMNATLNASVRLLPADWKMVSLDSAIDDSLPEEIGSSSKNARKK